MSTEEIRATNQWTERLTDIRPDGITRFFFVYFVGTLLLERRGWTFHNIVVS